MRTAVGYVFRGIAVPLHTAEVLDRYVQERIRPRRGQFLFDDCRQFWRIEVMISIEQAKRLDAYAKAVAEHTLANLAGEQSAELAEAEKWLRRTPLLPDGRPYDFAEKQAPVIVHELDRLRAEVATLRARNGELAAALEKINAIAYETEPGSWGDAALATLRKLRAALAGKAGT
jgi:hypothetical protein